MTGRAGSRCEGGHRPTCVKPLCRAMRPFLSGAVNVRPGRRLSACGRPADFDQSGRARFLGAVFFSLGGVGRLGARRREEKAHSANARDGATAGRCLSDRRAAPSSVCCLLFSFFAAARYSSFPLDATGALLLFRALHVCCASGRDGRPWHLALGARAFPFRLSRALCRRRRSLCSSRVRLCS